MIRVVLDRDDHPSALRRRTAALGERAGQGCGFGMIAAPAGGCGGAPAGDQPGPLS
jgi:hypothetical protein